jgi:hypothetical protein
VGIVFVCFLHALFESSQDYRGKWCGALNLNFLNAFLFVVDCFQVVQTE